MAYFNSSETIIDEELDEFVEILTMSHKKESNDHEKFLNSRKKKMDGLIEIVVLTPFKESEEKGNRVYRSRFVDSIKNEGTHSAFEKSRFVVKAFNDKKHGLITYEPTVQRTSQRLLLCFCAMGPDLKFFTRKIFQAYVQSSTTVGRPIFVLPPSPLGMPPDMLLRVYRPLYRIP